MPRELSPRLLRKLIDYNPETGALTWKARPRWMFPINRIYKAWNTKFAGKPALNSPDRNGYKIGAIFNSMYKAHRVAFVIHHGYWPDCVDHINGDGGDNRIENMRDVDQTGNGRNKAMLCTNTSGFNGVYWSKVSSQWSAYITVNRKAINLGRFDSFGDAVEARKRANKKYGFHENHGRQAA